MELNIYYKEHPEASLKEYYEAVITEAQKNIELAKERERKEMEWYEGLTKRYFKIQFNPETTWYTYIHISIFCPVKFLTYKVYKSIDISKITKSREKINELWFSNPYSPSLIGRPSITEISKDDFEEISYKIDIFLNQF